MSFRLSTLIPRVTAHSERDLFAWSLLAALALLTLLDVSFLPFRAAIGWEYLCSYPLMLAGMYFWLRRRLQRQDAAMVGSLAFTFSSFNLLHFAHPNTVATVAHIPWLLAMIDIVMVDAKRWKVALAQAFLALLTGSQILLGCPQYVWFSLLIEAGFTLFLVMKRKYLPRDGCETMPTCRVCIGCRRNSSSCVIVAKGIGLLVGAVQLLPALDALFQSTSIRTHEWIPTGCAGAVPEGTTLHPINLIQLVAPYLPINRAFGGSAHELSLYVGAVPLMLALWVLVRHNDLGGMKRSAQATAALAAAGLVLALGSQGRSVGFQNSIPWAAWFQFSCRYTVLFQFAVAVLAGIGFVLIEREARENQKIQRHLPLFEGESRAAALWRQFEILGAAVLVSLAVALVGLILHSGHQVASVPRVLVGPLLMAAAALLVIAAAHGIRGALVGLILFMAADLGYYGLSCTQYETGANPDGLLAQVSMKVPDPLPLARLVTHVVPSHNPADDLAK